MQAMPRQPDAPWKTNEWSFHRGRWKESNATEKPSSDESQMVGARAAKGVCGQPGLVTLSQKMK